MINNEFYKDLGVKWHESRGDAVALLRIEGATKSPWVLKTLNRLHGSKPLNVLDVGCGGGDLAIYLQSHGHQCTGLDTDDSILKVGRSRCPEARWVEGDTKSLPFANASFDVICMMDVLEHIYDPQRAIAEVARVLRPGGTFIFHTFNRTPISWLFAAKGLDWFIKDSPKHIHDWKMFIKPTELTRWLKIHNLEMVDLLGIRPRLFTKAMAKLILTGRVPESFKFTLTPSLQVGYMGAATASGSPAEKH